MLSTLTWNTSNINISTDRAAVENKSLIRRRVNIYSDDIPYFWHTYIMPLLVTYEVGIVWPLVHPADSLHALRQTWFVMEIKLWWKIVIRVHFHLLFGILMSKRISQCFTFEKLVFRQWNNFSLIYAYRVICAYHRWNKNHISMGKIVFLWVKSYFYGVKSYFHWLF